MDRAAVSGVSDFAVVRDVVDEIVALLEPCAVYLYSQKMSWRGELSSFKLCVIGGFEDRQAAERAVYHRVDSELPFDMLLYTLPEWEEHSADPDSFAYSIKKTGARVYG